MSKVKILAIDIGHNCKFDGGAVGIKSENELNLLVGRRLLERLKEVNVKVVFCSPSTASSLSNSLYQRVAAANKAKADFFLSIHHNACPGGYGSEALCIPGGIAESVGKSILGELFKLGLRNRGIKERRDLYLIKHTVMPALIVECAFVDSSSDMSGYNTNAVSEAIFNGLVNAFDFKTDGEQASDGSSSGQASGSSGGGQAPGSSSNSGGGQTSGNSTDGEAPPPTQNGQIYIVQKGDSLWSISRRFNTTIKKIAMDNGIKNTNVIYIGQKLKV